MFLIMSMVGAVLTFTYVNYSDRFLKYITGMTSDLLALSELAQARIPPGANRDQAIAAYENELKEAGISLYKIISPTGQVLKSNDPTQVGKKLKMGKKKQVAVKEEPIKLSGYLEDFTSDAAVDQKPTVVEFPIIQGDKVIGYAQVEVRGVSDQLKDLLARHYRDRLVLILATMLAGMFGVIYLASRFTRPISDLVKGAKQVAQGNLYVALPATDTDEMGTLAQTFNQMVERLRENRQLQERLNEAEKLSLLGRFAATVAHEVRNSLNFINLSIDQIRAKHATVDSPASRDLQRNIRNIKDEIARQNRLVNDFLAAGRQVPLTLGPCDLREPVEQAVALVEKQALSQEISIDVELPDDLPQLEADAGQMQTCFVNVLTNAVQAMPGGGKIRVSAEYIPSNGRAGAVRVLFADTGPGIPKENREKVFAQFFSTKATGFGLGLAITKKIVEDHGGRIQVLGSEAPGAVIAIELPLRRSAPSKTDLALKPAVV